MSVIRSIGITGATARGVRRLCRQVTLEQDGGGDAVYRALAFFPADVSGDQQIFRRLGRHPFVPQDERDRQTGFQLRGKFTHGFNGRPVTTIQLKRQPEDHPHGLMRLDQRRNVGNVTIERAPFEGFKRLSGPAQFVAERDADALGTVIERENTTGHDFTAGWCLRPG